MPRQKDLKRLVRARMQKTGEAYTAARVQILNKTTKSKTTTPKMPSTRAASASATSLRKASAKDYAELAGMSDKAIKEKTGCAWEKWVKSLDHYGAATMPHREIARLVHEKWGIDGWWSQAVAVGYERIKGLREIGQRRSGEYEASKSRTYAVPVAELFDAWADARQRKRWLEEAGVKMRTATAPKSMRLGWPDGTIVSLWFTAKGAKSSVSVQHTKLPDRATAERLKKYWAERLAALGEVLPK